MSRYVLYNEDFTTILKLLPYLVTVLTLRYRDRALCAIICCPWQALCGPRPSRLCSNFLFRLWSTSCKIIVLCSWSADRSGAPVNNPPKFFKNGELWHDITVKNGSIEYVKKILQELKPENVRKSTGVTKIKRVNGKVHVFDDKGNEEVFDSVVSTERLYWWTSSHSCLGARVSRWPITWNFGRRYHWWWRDTVERL